MGGLHDTITVGFWQVPTRDWRQTPHDVLGALLMTFAGIQGDLPAAVESKKTLLLSVHPEAYENYGIRGLTTEQRTANYRWLANAINNVVLAHPKSFELDPEVIENTE
jgi:hypothetical protein